MPPSTSEGIWTLQTHPKHLLRRYLEAQASSVDFDRAPPSELGPVPLQHVPTPGRGAVAPPQVKLSLNIHPSRHSGHEGVTK